MKYGLEINDSDEVMLEYWSNLAISYQNDARKVVAALDAIAKERGDG